MKNAHHFKFSGILLTLILLIVSVATPAWIQGKFQSTSSTSISQRGSIWNDDVKKFKLLSAAELDLVRSFAIIGPVFLLGAALMVYLQKKKPMILSMMILMGVISSAVVVGLWAKVPRNMNNLETSNASKFGYSYFLQVAGLATGVIAFGISYLKYKKK